MKNHMPVVKFSVRIERSNAYSNNPSCLSHRPTLKRYKGFAMAVLIGLLCGCGRAAKVNASDAGNALPVAVAKTMRRNLSSTLDIASEFEPYQEINVYAKVSGYIQKLDVNWGTHVKQGQVLAVLEIPELQQQLQLDESTVKRGEQDLARANEELMRAKSTYNVAHLTYTRLAGVQKTRPELVAQEEVDVAQGKDLEASAGVSAAEIRLQVRSRRWLGRRLRTRKTKRCMGMRGSPLRSMEL